MVPAKPNYRAEIVSQIRPRKGSLMINCAPINLLFKYKSKMSDLIKASRDTSGIYDRDLFIALENIELDLDNATQNHCVLKSGDEYFGGYLTSVNEKY